MPPMRRKGVARRSLMNAKRSVKSKYSRKKKSKNNNSSSRSIVKMLTDNQLHVFQYPFSTRTKYPKIPDGKVDHSVGLNFAFSQNVKFNPAQPVYIVLYGGHTTCACIFNFTTPAGANAPRGNIISYGKFVQYMIPRYHDTNGGSYKLVFDQCGYSSYRYVSAGLRIAADDGPWKVGGQWQAIRLPCNKLNRDFRYVYDQTHVDWNTVLPTSTFMESIAAVRFEDNPTFQSGMLKTIDDFEFRLKSQNLEHMFQAVPDFLDLDNNHYNQNIAGFGTEVVNDGEDLQHQFDFTLDDNFDIVVVKIDSSGFLDNITYQVTANVECVTNLVGQFGHFSTETINAADRFHRLKHKMMNDNRLPGAYNFNKRYRKAM